jgi:hypothetical protein
MRHSVRAALAVLQAKEHAQRAYQQLHVCVANDRTDGGAPKNRVPRYMYPRFLAVCNPSVTKNLPGFLYLFGLFSYSGGSLVRETRYRSRVQLHRR